MKLSEKIASTLLQINAIRLNPQNPFTWASGMRAPVYCDNRLALSHPSVRNLILDGYLEVSGNFLPVDAIAGVATAGIAYGALVADRLKLPFAYVRSSAKTHGRQNKIEGQLPNGAVVLVIEDLISTGGSSLAAVHALRELGFLVKAVVAIFQYNLAEANRHFAEETCDFRTLTDFKTLITVAAEQGMIASSDLSLLEAWHTDPVMWQQTSSTS
jgi:orotate phosphoribosyltransferase